MKTYAAIGLALLVGAALGRWLAPTKVEYREKEREEIKQGKAESHEAKTDWALALDTGATESVHERTVRRPDGTIQHDVTRKLATTASTRSQGSEEKREAKIEYKDRIVEREVVKLVTAERAQWSLEARAGLTIVGARPAYSGTVARRIFGPIWAGAWADSEKAAGVAVRIEW